jgi:hypothetical protein
MSASNTRRSARNRSTPVTIVRADRVTAVRTSRGLWRWRALERAQFLVLVAAPGNDARTKGRSR